MSADLAADEGGLKPILLVTVLMACAGLAFAHLLSSPLTLFPLDDAYIVLHNASVLLRGEDPSFPGVPALAGTTSVVHLALVGAFGRILPLEWALWTVGWLAIAFFAAGVCRLASIASMPTPLALTLVAVALLVGEVPYHLLNGLETGLGLATLTWMFALFLAPPKTRPWLLPLVLGQAPFVRPELALLSAILLVARALEATPPEKRWPRLARETAIAVTGALVWLGLLALATGSLVPQTIAVKREFFAEGCRALYWKLKLIAEASAGYFQFLGPAILGFAMLALHRVGRLGLLFGVGFLATYLVNFPGAVWHNDHRYLALLSPLVALGFVLIFRDGGRVGRRLVVLSLPLLALFALVRLPSVGLRLYRENLAITSDELAPLAEYIRSNFSAGEPILIHDIGYLSYSLPFQFVDAVGLKNEEAARLHRELTAPSCGRLRTVAIQELILERKVRVLVLFDFWDDAFHLSRGLRDLGWQLDQQRTSFSRYRVFLLTPPAQLFRPALPPERGASRRAPGVPGN